MDAPKKKKGKKSKGAMPEENADAGLQASPSVASMSDSSKRSRRSQPVYSLTSATSAVIDGKKMEGIVPLPISLEEQARFECQIGDQLNAGTPWVFVIKERLELDIEQRGEESPFFKFQDKIREYPGFRLRIGYDVNSKATDQLFLAFTAEGEANVNMLIEEIRAKQALRVLNALNRPVGLWSTLGSEKEVEESQVCPTRPFYEQDTVVRFTPHFNPEFTDTNVEDLHHGYVELTNFEFNKRKYFNIKRVLVDKEVQASPFVIDREAQTYPIYLTNQWTQYEFVVDTEKPLTDELAEEVRDFLTEVVDRFEPFLTYNDGIDIQCDDYLKLVLDPKDTKVPPIISYDEVDSFLHVDTTGEWLCSATDWHPSITGIVACAYVDNIRTMLKESSIDKKSTKDSVLEDIYGQSLCILWCFTDRFRPKLYLECPRPVHSLKFCPYYENILIGGMVSGQIVLWDLKDRIEIVEKTERLTDLQARYRMILSEHVLWMNNVRNLARVKPVAVSAVEFSHTTCITGIRWLTPYWVLSRTGRFPPGPEEPDFFDLPFQFFTSSEDGTINFWDLKVTQSAKTGAFQKKRWKVRKRPPGMEKSQFAHLNRFIRPHYQIVLHLPEESEGASADSDNVPLQFPTSVMEYQSFPVVYSIPSDPQNTSIAAGVMTYITKDYMWGEGMRKYLAERAAKNTLKVGDSDEEDETWRLPLIDTEPGVPLTREDDDLGDIDYESDSEDDSKKAKWDLKGIEERQQFFLLPSIVMERPNMKINLGSIDGTLTEVTWEGLDGNINAVINFENGEFGVSSSAVHDGPIFLFQRNLFIPELFVSIGGRVFAIWREDVREAPMLWKRSPERITAGGWSRYRPSVLQIIRADGVLEIWDLAIYSHRPAFAQNLSGSQMMTLAFPSLPLAQKVMSLADFNGAIRVFLVPDAHCEPPGNDMAGEIAALRFLFDKAVKRKEVLLMWQERKATLRSTMISVLDDELLQHFADAADQEEEEEIDYKTYDKCTAFEEEFLKYFEPILKPNAVKMLALQRWVKQEEEHMKRMLLKRMRLDKEGLLRAQEPLRILQAQEELKAKRLYHELQKKHEMFDKVLNVLFPERQEEEELRKVARAHMKYLYEISKMKGTFVAEYEKVEAEALKYIETHPYMQGFDWMYFIGEGIERRLQLDPALVKLVGKMGSIEPPHGTYATLKGDETIFCQSVVKNIVERAMRLGEGLPATEDDMVHGLVHEMIGEVGTPDSDSSGHQLVTPNEDLLEPEVVEMLDALIPGEEEEEEEEED